MAKSPGVLPPATEQPAPLTAGDRFLQRRRIAQALRWIEPGSHVLDVGCADGALFRRARGRIASGVGIEPDPPAAWVGPPFERRVGLFPAAVGDDETYDAIVMLAVVEHVPADELRHWSVLCRRLLRPGGRLVMTVPSPAVDLVLHAGIRLHLLAGMDAHHHHGFSPREVPQLFGGHLALQTHRRFQLGMNNLFVFRR